MRLEIDIGGLWEENSRFRKWYWGVYGWRIVGLERDVLGVYGRRIVGLERDTGCLWEKNSRFREGYWGFMGGE